jgi:hypothetical protein
MRCAANKVIAIDGFTMELILIIVLLVLLFGGGGDTGVAVEVIGDRRWC